MKRTYALSNMLLCLCILCGCSNPKKEWSKANSINTIDAFNGFINRYPDSEYVQEAKNKIADLKCQLEWSKTQNENTMDALKRFMDQYPDCEFKAQAKSKLAELEYGTFTVLQGVLTQSMSLAFQGWGVLAAGEPTLTLSTDDGKILNIRKSSQCHGNPDKSTTADDELLYAFLGKPKSIRLGELGYYRCSGHIKGNVFEVYEINWLKATKADKGKEVIKTVSKTIKNSIGMEFVHISRGDFVAKQHFFCKFILPA